ncbi:unnamed protein product, partial [Effrenium voratum]
GGRGPDLVSVCLPAIEGEKSHVSEGKVPGAKLPSSVVELLSKEEMPPMVTCKMGDYQHSFVFHLLDEVVAQSWLPRAQVNHRWEIEETATECHFGYKWVALSDWGPCLGEGALLCSWLK